jgi:predicted nucleic acid-binding protein
MFLPDSDCMIAAVSQWHVHHVPASSEIDRRLSTGEPMVIAAPALVETYAVLTRLPRPYRLPPTTCLMLVQASFLANADRVIALGADAYIELVRRTATGGIGGGRICDAVIAACGRVAGADVLLTFNERHFLPFAGQGMAIVVPSAGGSE